jgi:putative membrane protein insertion efficiency factor
VKSAGVWFLLGFVRFYQVFLGPFFGGACKFYPSCSRYAYEAIERHGARRGIVLALKRLGRCRPFTQGGYDPVPEKIEKDTEGTSLIESSVPRGRERRPFAGTSEGGPIASVAQGEPQ